MGDTTSIDDLPTDPSSGNMNNNVVLQKMELSSGAGGGQGQVQGQVYNPSIAGLGGGGGGPTQPQMPPTPNIMNEMISGLQRASASGMTNLPSRDIPMTTSNMMNDAQIKPNFIPNPQAQVQGQHINQYGPRPMPSNNYIEEHEPVIVGILYFAFQLPVMRKYVLKFIPSVFNSDGNYNISGLIFMSSLFAASFFGLSKVLEMSESW